MEQQLSSDTPTRLNSQPGRINWGVMPLLMVAGLVSALETEMSILRSEYNGGGNLTSTVLLSGLCLGLTIITALWFYRRIQSWTSAALLVVMMVVANCSPLFYKYVPSAFYQDKDLPLLGTTALYLFAFIFPSCFVAFIGFALVLLPPRKALRTLPMAIFSAGLATLTFALIVDLQRGAWFSFWSAEPLGLLWQNTLASFLGLSLWLGQITVGAGSPTLKPSRFRAAGSSLRNGFISLGLLVGYFICLHVWTGAVVKRYARSVEQYQARVKTELAQSLAEAPSRENLPAVEQKPIDEALLRHKIGGWAPYGSDSRMLPAETTLPAYEKANTRALLPQRYLSSVSYWDGGNGMALPIVNVTTYPTADWARYELRHIPTSNEIIIRPDSVKQVMKFGNRLYQEGPYFYWPSGDKLVFLNFMGMHQSVIDDFLKVYLEKYPSAL
jgi:hypothetical protein